MSEQKALTMEEYSRLFPYLHTGGITEEAWSNFPARKPGVGKFFCPYIPVGRGIGCTVYPVQKQELAQPNTCMQMTKHWGYIKLDEKTIDKTGNRG